MMVPPPAHAPFIGRRRRHSVRWTGRVRRRTAPWPRTNKFAGYVDGRAIK